MAALELPTMPEIEALLRRVVREELERGKPEELISIEEAAQRSGVSVATIRRQVRSARLPSKRVGRQYRIPASALRPANEAEVVELAHAARHGRR